MSAGSGCDREWKHRWLQLLCSDSGSKSMRVLSRQTGGVISSRRVSSVGRVCSSRRSASSPLRCIGEQHGIGVVLRAVATMAAAACRCSRRRISLHFCEDFIVEFPSRVRADVAIDRLGCSSRATAVLAAAATVAAAAADRQSAECARQATHLGGSSARSAHSLFHSDRCALSVQLGVVCGKCACNGLQH